MIPLSFDIRNKTNEKENTRVNTIFSMFGNTRVTHEYKGGSVARKTPRRNVLKSVAVPHANCCMRAMRPRCTCK